jgi:nucleotide-binding universal stress UspA family protein
MNGKPILVPVDFEEASTAALETAVDLSRKLDGYIVLLHVRPLAVGSYAYPGVAPYLIPTLNDELDAAARRSLDDLAEKYGITQRMLRVGDAATEILEVTREVAPMMVVMGTHGRKGLARLFLGSVAAKVIRHSPVPVLTVHPPAASTERAA